MATIAESATWDVGVYQISDNDKVLGGTSGVVNMQALSLVNRTAYLKGQVDSVAIIAADSVAKADSVIAQIASIEASVGAVAASAAAAQQSSLDASAAKALAQQSESVATVNSTYAADQAAIAAASAISLTAAKDAALSSSLSASQSATSAAASAASALNHYSFRGAWSITGVYARNDAVTSVVTDYGVFGFVSLQDGNVNNQPPIDGSSNVWWGVYAAGGADGFGDMQASKYDPNGFAVDAFARSNHTGVVPASEVSNIPSGGVSSTVLQDAINQLDTGIAGKMDSGMVIDGGSQPVKIKRSASPNIIPLITDISLGELMINTFDGKLYLKKSNNGTETVVEVGGGGVAQANALSVALTMVLY